MPLRRGELAKRTGCNIETIRYYERIGLLPDPPRSDNGFRSYEERHLTAERLSAERANWGLPSKKCRIFYGWLMAGITPALRYRRLRSGMPMRSSAR